MSLPTAIAPPAVAPRDKTAAAALPGDAGMQPRMLAVEWFARKYGHPFSQAAVLAHLPEGLETGDIGLLCRALAAVGLKSRIALRKIAAIDPVVLPCIVFAGDGQPIVLLRLDKRRRIATVIELAEGAHEQEIAIRDLRRRAGRSILLVTPDNERAEGRLSATAPVLEPRGNWFWSAFWSNWNAWFQVLIAALAMNVLGLALPIFVMTVYDRVIPNLAFVTLWTLALGVGIALFLELLLRTIRTSVLDAVSRNIDLKVSSNLFRQAMNVRLLDRPGGAAGFTTHIRDFEVVREFFASSTFVSIVDLLFIGVFVAVLFLIVGPLALVPLAAIPVVLFLALVAQVPIGRTVEKAQRMATKRHTVLSETLLGIETIKSLNAEPVMQREWENAVAATARINGRTRFWSSIATNGTALVLQAVSVGIIVWGVFLVSEGRITIGGLIAANLLAGRALGPLGNIAQTLFRSQYAFKSMRTLSQFMKLPVEARDTVQSDLRVSRGALRLQGVSFTYPGAQVAALTGIDLDVAPGECVALLGKVGSGKTTTGKLINGLLQPSEGIILVDGVEINQYEAAELRDGIGYLTQDSDLFTGTIRENLLIGKPNATEDEIKRALYFAAMDQFVDENPEGLNQFVGEKGSRLSGGQRQGIALARLLVRRPRLLFLDEPTNAMDQQMEAAIALRLKELGAEGTGMILCTHRQSLANVADRLVVIDRGRKILDGPRGEVLDRLRKASVG